MLTMPSSVQTAIIGVFSALIHTNFMSSEDHSLRSVPWVPEDSFSFGGGKCCGDRGHGHDV